MIAWDDLRYFLAVARLGTLSAAARALGVAQPTVGRRLVAFERRLGARLVHRSPTTMSLTAAGEALRVHAERMEREALAAELATSGRDEALRGRVRITAAEWVAVRVLPRAVAALVEHHPELTVDVLADPRHLNLARRDADLAIRPSRFTQASVYQRRLGAAAFALYASPSYLARHGMPDAGGQCGGHAMIAMSEDVGDAARVWLEAHARKARIVSRTHGREEMATLAAAGVGLACLPRVVGDASPGLRRVPAPAMAARTLWLGVHRDVRDVPRVRATIATLVAEVGTLAALDPPT